jgi:hypothetical protein
MKVQTQTGRFTESKARLLDKAGYAYSFDRQMYVNRKAKKAFSINFIQDRSEDEIQDCMKKRANGTGWHFYFIDGPSKAVARELESVLG